jgi:hypothetical protein
MSGRNKISGKKALPTWSTVMVAKATHFNSERNRIISGNDE